MTDLTPSEQVKETVAEVRKQQQEKKQELIGTLKPHRGHTLYKVNKETLEISKAEFEQVDYVVGQKKPNRRVIVDKIIGT
jgi:copper oxidase (laccase) domain-containing protein